MDMRSLEKEISLIPKWVDAFQHSLVTTHKKARLVTVFFSASLFFVSLSSKSLDIYMFLGLCPLLTLAQFAAHAFGMHQKRLTEAYFPRVIRICQGIKKFPTQSPKVHKFLTAKQLYGFDTDRKLFWHHFNSMLPIAGSLGALGFLREARERIGFQGAGLCFLIALCLNALLSWYFVKKTKKLEQSLPHGSLDEYAPKILETPKAV